MNEPEPTCAVFSLKRLFSLVPTTKRLDSNLFFFHKFLTGTIYQACKALGVNAMFLENTFDVLKNEQSCPRTVLPTKMYNVVGGRNNSDSFLYVYDLKSNGWTRNRFLKYTFMRGGAKIFVRDQLVVIGGCSVSWVRSINCHTGEIKKLKSMTSPRHKMSLVYFENEIYAFGGFDAQSTLHTAVK